MEETQTSQKGGLNPLAIAGVVALVLIGGLVLLMNRNNTASQTANQQTTQQTQQAAPTATADTTQTQVSGAPSPSGAMSDTMSAMEEGKTITVTGDNFAFDPKEIRVKKGQKVTIMFKNAEGFHDFVLDEFNVKTKQLQAGGSETVTFTPDRTGTFEYYCSVGKHREMGMVGKLIVE